MLNRFVRVWNLNSIHASYSTLQKPIWSSFSRSFHASAAISHSSNEKLSVVIVGSGPSGCYTAKYLISSFENHLQMKFHTLEIDLLEKLPTPFGLVRSGVAPDHQEVKNVEHDFSKLFETYSSKDKKCSIEFRGNVNVGRDISLKELQDLYDVVVLAYGCESDRKLGIQGENLKGIFSAREFVAWYNGHPDFQYLQESFKCILRDPENAQVVIIGQGNVALDCARILSKGRKGLDHTDISSSALEVIDNGVKSAIIIGRRGHIQGAYTIKELRELTKLQDTDFVVHHDDLHRGSNDESMAELHSDNGRPKIRIHNLLNDAAQKYSQEGRKHDKKIELRFFLSPLKFIPDSTDESKMTSILCEITKLEGKANDQVAIGTGEIVEIPAHMALISIGYRGKALQGMNTHLFDSRKGIVRNAHGKVESNLYVSGWLKRGPTGIIGTNIFDARDTTTTIMNDLESGEIKIKNEEKSKGRIVLDSILSERMICVVNWEKFKKIDEIEKNSTRLRNPKQPREKVVKIDDMLKCF